MGFKPIKKKEERKTPLIGWPRYFHNMLFQEFTAYLHIELHKC